MPDRDTTLARLGDVYEALALLTRFPVRTPLRPRGGHAAWAYPLAGLPVGVAAALAAGLAGGLGLPAPLVAGLALACLIVATGALHEDGLADTADGLWGGWTVEQRLEIMQDSRIGAYGVIALILSLGMRWAALAAIAASSGLTAALIAAAILSRAPMVAVMGLLPHARDAGLSSRVGRPPRDAMLLALAIALGVGAILIGTPVLKLALLLGLVTVAIALIAKRKIGGQTGDVLGATQQISEITILAFLAAQAHAT